MEHKFGVAVVGGGIAGYSAALSLKSLGIDYLWLGAELFGEKVKACEYVRNFPAFTGNGAEFFKILERQRRAEGVVFTVGRADGIYRTGEGFLITAGKETYESDAVILCTGVDLKGKLKGEETFVGRGVSYCAVCDGALYRGKKIAAVLSSEKFADEAEYLAGFADMVYAFCPEPISFSHPNIQVCPERPTAVEGDTRVKSIVAGGEVFAVDGVFFLRDAVPPATLVGGLRTEGAHICVDRTLAASLKGLFAAGDVTGPPYQFAKAAGEGLLAAHSAKKYLTAR